MHTVAHALALGRSARPGVGAGNHWPERIHRQVDIRGGKVGGTYLLFFGYRGNMYSTSFSIDHFNGCAIISAVGAQLQVPGWAPLDAARRWDHLDRGLIRFSWSHSLSANDLAGRPVTWLCRAPSSASNIRSPDLSENSGARDRGCTCGKHGRPHDLSKEASLCSRFGNRGLCRTAKSGWTASKDRLRLFHTGQRKRVRRSGPLTASLDAFASRSREMPAARRRLPLIKSPWDLLSSFNLLQKNWDHSLNHNVPRCTTTTVIEPISASAVAKSSLLQCSPAMLKTGPLGRPAPDASERWPSQPAPRPLPSDCNATFVDERPIVIATAGLVDPLRHWPHAKAILSGRL